MLFSKIQLLTVKNLSEFEENFPQNEGYVLEKYNSSNCKEITEKKISSSLEELYD